MLAINFSLKVIQEVVFYINTFKQDMIAVGNENQKNKTKIDGIIVIICLYYHCWGIIIVYRYYIWINVLFGLKKQVNVLMILRLDIWLIQVCILIYPSATKQKNVRVLHLVHSQNLLLKPNYIKQNKCFSIIHVSWHKKSKA